MVPLIDILIGAFAMVLLRRLPFGFAFATALALARRLHLLKRFAFALALELHLGTNKIVRVAA